MRPLGPGRPFGEKWIGRGIGIEVIIEKRGEVKGAITDVGFTGTRHGMTNRQHGMVDAILAELYEYNQDITFHHGDCLGADAEAHALAEKHGYKFKIHPPSDNRFRAFMTRADLNQITWAAPAPYPVRNRAIVDESQLLIGTPRERKEVLRSGTWSTIRYARATALGSIIVFPP